jgi:peptidoglycan hydrolase-like amidase
MHLPQRIGAALVLAALLVASLAAPMATPAPASAAAECGSYRSETVPPPTIRVFRTGSGAVDTVDFRAYVKNVLSREWLSDWTTESLRSGALAVKNYGWYYVLHWRGYVNTDGECFDVFDSTRDQVYNPSKPTYAAMADAVDATWDTLAHRDGLVFPTYYNAGLPSEPCGANANGWQMFQWGTQACGLAGKSAAEIMAIYYAGVVITPPPTSTPTPTPAPTPAPRPVATPPPLGRPGGGQVGMVRPPAPPPPDPEPIVAKAGARWFSRAELARAADR